MKKDGKILTITALVLGCVIIGYVPVIGATLLEHWGIPLSFIVLSPVSMAASFAAIVLLLIAKCAFHAKRRLWTAALILSILIFIVNGLAFIFGWHLSF